ncbi:ParB N-terminal domain-containing protein [Morganella morganii]|uniref:ParB N-terminal domain-containing protein n=1 Tax=Morganella morganii TaxID=582 RepID=UPI001BDB1E62|nr:ParB N-terminal domain-containing protein [Morganella morganii]MBT0360459.1 ParB N-terminal domain-containing protein [Morganella morganii subsp. morganii]
MERIDFSSWKKITLTVSALKLDRKNPRIPDYEPTRTTKDIVRFLFKNEKILSLIEKIVNKGFINHDPIYVIKEKEYYVVVEGNRRLTALKCLLDPSLAPTIPAQKKIEKLKVKLGNDLIEKIEVVVAPSRLDVENVLFELHSEGKQQWSRQQKNKFISESGISSGESIEQIAARFDVSTREIYDSVQEYLIEKYFPYIGLTVEQETKALNSSFSISFMSRILNSAYFKEKTGYKIDKNAIKTTISERKFKYILKHIVCDILDKKIDSRSLNKIEEINDYLEKIMTKPLSDDDHDDDNPVNFTPSSGTNSDVDDNIKQPKIKRKKQRLIDNSIHFNTGVDKLDYLIQEGQSLWIDTHKTAGALLLRTILELAVIRVFDINKSKNLCFNPKGRTNQLSMNLKSLVKKDDWFANKTYLNDLRTFIDPNCSSWQSLESLNRYAHGEFTIPDRDMLIQVWLITKPLILYPNI